MVGHLVINDNGQEYEGHQRFPVLFCESKELAEDIVSKIYEWYESSKDSFPDQPKVSVAWVQDLPPDEREIWDAYRQEISDIYDSCPYGVGREAIDSIPLEEDHQKAFSIDKIPFIKETTEKS